MIARFNSPFLALLLAAPLVLTTACTEDRALTVNSGDRIIGENQEQPDGLDAQARLVHVAPECDVQSTFCPRSVNIGDRATLKVQLLDADDEPIENAFISFDLERIEGASGSSLSAARGVTNSNGIASIDFGSGEDNPAANAGTARVKAFIDDQDEIDPIEFNIGINTKAGGSYVIKYTHDGEAALEQVFTTSFVPNLSCDDILDTYFANRHLPLAPDAVDNLPSAIVHPNGDISPVIYPRIPNGTSYTIVGIARTEVGAGEVDFAYGCSDNNPPVENGQDVHIEVPLIDHLPHIGQTYSVDHAFNITHAFPPAIQNIIQLIESLATSPAAFILGDKLNNKPGLIDLLLDLDIVPENVKNIIDGFRDGPLYGAALDFLDGVLEDILPDWVKTGMTGAADITDMLQRFSVRGRMTFDKQPDLDLSGDQVVGILYEEDNQQFWDTIIFRWSQGCQNAAPSCSSVEVNASGYTSDEKIIEGNFAARLQGSNKLRIERHSLSLHYGALLLAAIEKVVLPRIFQDPDDPNAPPVDSIDAMLERLINCPDLVSSAGPNLAQSLELLCRQLVGNAGDAFRNYVTETLVADGEDYFQLETAPGNDCTLYQPTNYVGDSWPGKPFPYVERLGKNEADKQCEWKTYIRFSSDAEPKVIGGTFHGELF